MTTQTQLDLTADTIDVRDIIARIEELEGLIEDEGCADTANEYDREHGELLDVLDELKGYGGDEQWRGDWYPVTLIADSHFTDYARELLEDCGTVPADLPSWVEIDWQATARNVRTDYAPVDIDGSTYWYR
jgi:hypothetical protein